VNVLKGKFEIIEIAIIYAELMTKIIQTVYERTV
jgi:hypothetical protein